MTYIIIALSLLAGRYVDMPLWMLLGIGIAGVWEIKQLKEASKE